MVTYLPYRDFSGRGLRLKRVGRTKAKASRAVLRDVVGSLARRR